MDQDRDSGALATRLGITYFWRCSSAPSDLDLKVCALEECIIQATRQHSMLTNDDGESCSLGMPPMRRHKSRVGRTGMLWRKAENRGEQKLSLGDRADLVDVAPLALASRAMCAAEMEGG